MSSARRADPAPPLIDVKELIAAYDVAEHVRRADSYFDGWTFERTEFRKPFMNLETIYVLRHLGAVLPLMELFAGARVIDFGCGTAWLAQSLALMGCRVVAVDASRRALELGRAYTAAKHPELAGQIEYLPFDGRRLDLPDGSVDRVICFDSFHHVPDQAAVLAEFHRVLAPDGLAAFAEPGPAHSRSAAAQEAMREFGVIENDIVLEDIWRAAKAVGFRELCCTPLEQSPMRLSLGDMASLKRRWTAGRVMRRAYRELFRPAYRGMRIFTLSKARTTPDSRRTDGLAGELRLAVTAEDHGLRVQGAAKNTGKAAWRPSGETPGSVNLGLRVKDADGRWRDVGRLAFLAEPLAAGREARIDVRVETGLGVGETEGELWADLVAEHVAWFSQLGSAPVRLA
jgi:SAM-dependent methyltransferase